MERKITKPKVKITEFINYMFNFKNFLSMKKFLFMAAALVAMASCSNNDYFGDSPTEALADGQGLTNAINFGFDVPYTTRAAYKYGSDAATKLGEKFVVYGTKHIADVEDKTATYDAPVFNNFQVQWAASTAGTTASNSSDWEYVGKQSYDATPTAQGIKYWDYSAANGYTFTAFSSTDITYPKNGTDLVSVTKVASDESSLYNKGYEVTVKSGATLNNLYFSDRVEVPKAKFGNTVSLTFRNVGAKVRFGFYETIPGYSVQIDKFYIDDANSAAVTDFANMNDAQDDGFYASLQNVKTSADQTINVTYYSSGDVINRPKVSNPTGGYNYYIKIGTGAIIGTDLADNSANPTWAVAAGAYTPVFPFEGNSNPLLVKLDFTLTADAEPHDVIHVRGARAIVPAKYVQWKGNFAYTYIFKISDMTNGTTGAVDANGDPTDPEGLKAITFDAVVIDVDNEKQETITTVSTNSITTYAQGAIVNEYSNGKPIYVSITDNSTHNVITPSAIGTAAGEAQVYKLSASASEASVLAKLNGSPQPFTMTATTLTEAAAIGTTVPLADGTTPAISNVEFTPSAAGTYAYVYTTTAYVAPGYTVQTEGTYNSGNTYYMKNASNTYYVVSVPNAEAFNDNKSSLYLRTSAGTAGVYDVKVIKVQ